MYAMNAMFRLVDRRMYVFELAIIMREKRG